MLGEAVCEPCYSKINYFLFEGVFIMYITEDGRTYNLKSAICKKGHLQISTLQPE